jgi:hypothetical protein
MPKCRRAGFVGRRGYGGFLPGGQHVPPRFPTESWQAKEVGQQNDPAIRQHTSYVILEYNIPLKQLSKSLEQNFSGISARPPAGRSDRAEMS